MVTGSNNDNSRFVTYLSLSLSSLNATFPLLLLQTSGYVTVMVAVFATFELIILNTTIQGILVKVLSWGITSFLIFSDKSKKKKKYFKFQKKIPLIKTKLHFCTLATYRNMACPIYLFVIWCFFSKNLLSLHQPDIDQTRAAVQWLTWTDKQSLVKNKYILAYFWKEYFLLK